MEFAPFVRSMFAKGPSDEFWDWVLTQGSENWAIQFGRYDGALVGLEAGGLEAIAAGGLPVVGIVGVALALGAPYAQARELVRNEESTWGFAEGFVMGVLGWDWSNVSSLFYRHGVIRIYQTDEALNSIRVGAYNVGLKMGFLVGALLPSSMQGAFLAGLRKRAGHPSSSGWSRNVQVSFVIGLAAAFRRFVFAT